MSGTRQLQSITVASSLNNGTVFFTATGTYTAPPVTVTPLPASWTLGSSSPLSGRYQLTTQPFPFSCASAIAASEVTAFAPADPNAPNSGPTLNTQLIVASAPISCQ
jgi:hypothetical protein